MKKLTIVLIKGIALAGIVVLGLIVFLAVGGDDGSARTELTNVNVTALTAPAASTIYAQVDDPERSGFYRSTDGGQSWELVSRDLDKRVNTLAASASNPRVIYAGTAGGSAVLGENSLYVSSDGGRSWNKTPLTLPANASGRIPAVTSLTADRENADVLYVGTDGQGIYRLSDKGTTLVALGNELYGARVNQIVIAPQDVQRLYAVTSRGLFESRNAGESWERVTTLPEQAVTLAIAPSNRQILYAGTASMGAYRSEDGGQTWQAIGDGLGLTPGVALSVRSIEVDKQNPYLVYATPSYILGTGQAHELPLGLYMSNDGGNSWQKLEADSPLTGRVHTLLQAPGQYGQVLLGTEQGVFGASWDGIAAPASETRLSGTPANTTDSGALSRVLIILLTVMAAAVVALVNPLRFFQRASSRAS